VFYTRATWGENRGMEKYLVTLTAEEREQLEAIVSKGSHRSQKAIAVSLMASQGESTSNTMTLMVGPLDARRGSTRVIDLAVSKPLIGSSENSSTPCRLRAEQCLAESVLHR
jgi:hypothetical protein